MANIANINNGEDGLSVRNKLNSVIDAVNTNILTINNDNISTYYGLMPSGRYFIKNVPINTDIISIEVTGTTLIPYGINFVSTPNNGKRITIMNNVHLDYACSSSETTEGRFSQYLYGYLFGVSGGSSILHLVDAFSDFIYWNGVMYSKGY